MWAQYCNELWNRDTIQTESGFICYQIITDQCHIIDLYVLPEKRKSVEAFKLIDMVVTIAKEKNCKILHGSVHIQSKGSEHACVTNIKYGMNIAAAENNRIFFKKEI